MIISGVFDRSLHGTIYNARITVTYVCFIALTFAGSLGRSWNTGPCGLVFKQLPRDPANVNAWKIMYDPYYTLEQCLVTLYWGQIRFLWSLYDPKRTTKLVHDKSHERMLPDPRHTRRTRTRALLVPHQYIWRILLFPADGHQIILNKVVLGLL